jgi:hypothetical protein
MSSKKKPEFATFRFQRNKMATVLLPILASGAIVLFLFVRRSDPLQAIELALLGVGWGLALAVYLVGPCFFYLELSPECLEFRFLGGRRSFEWGEIRNLRVIEKGVYSIDSHPIVVFDLAPTSPQRSTFRRMAKSVKNYDVAVPGVFVRDPIELLRLLWSWHDRYAPQDSLPPVETPTDFADRFKHWKEKYGHENERPTTT